MCLCGFECVADFPVATIQQLGNGGNVQLHFAVAHLLAQAMFSGWPETSDMGGVSLLWPLETVGAWRHGLRPCLGDTVFTGKAVRSCSCFLEYCERFDVADLPGVWLVHSFQGGSG